VDSLPTDERPEVIDAAKNGLGWQGWMVLLALVAANLLIVAILYQSFILGE
jgi:hypothetical protein